MKNKIEKDKKNKFIFGIALLVLILLGIFYFIYFEKNIFLSPQIPVPEISSLEVINLYMRYADVFDGTNNCAFPKIIPDYFNRSQLAYLLDDNENTICSTEFRKQASLQLNFSTICSFTKLEISFGKINKKQEITISCIDRGKEKLSKSYVYDSALSNKARTFELAKKFNCKNVKINFVVKEKFAGVFLSDYFNLKEIKFR